MEERVRFCEQCNAVVGWFAIFCEQCGARQKAAERAMLAQVGAAATALPESSGSSGGGDLPPAEARTLARDLFRTQLRLVHRHRQQAEEVEADITALEREVQRIDSIKPLSERRRQLDRLSERLLGFEHRWEEMQRSYNRESEDIEETCREQMESAEMDAYLTPDEQAAVEAEYAALSGKLDALDAALRGAGKALALARKRVQSRYFGLAASSSGLAVALLLLGLSGVVTTVWWSSLGQPLDLAALATRALPATAGVLLLFGLAVARR